MYKQRWNRLFLLVLASLSVSSAAHANAGTPLMWAGMLHLLFGNALIGIGEGLLIAWLFRVQRGNAIRTMIAANYFSAWVGFLILMNIQAKLQFLTIHDMPRALWAMVGLSFLATVILEWPFCLWALKQGETQRRGLLRASILASLIVQAASYAVLVPWYMLTSSTTLLKSMKVDRTLSFTQDCRATVYFINNKDGGVYRVSCNGTGLSKVVDSRADDDHTLFLLLTPGLRNWSLYVGDPDAPESALLLVMRFAEVPSGVEIPRDRRRMAFLADLCPSADYQPTTKTGWDVRTEFWAGWGLRVSNRKARDTSYYGFETPFLQWRTHSATVLPGGLVIYQLGDQIIALNLETKRIGLLAMGRSPAVTFRDTKEIDREIREAFGRIRAEEKLRGDP